MVELGLKVPCIKPSEGKAGRGFCDQCLSEADAFVFEVDRVLSATASIVRSEGIRRSRTQIQGGFLWLTFLGRSRKVSAARHERDHGEQKI
jgi:hypothetical protein